MSHLLGSVQNKNVFLHLESEICKPEHLCRITVLILMPFCNRFEKLELAILIWILHLAML